MKLALAGYRALRSSAADTVVADGFTEDQQFFLGYGQVWCEQSRPEMSRMLATRDVEFQAAREGLSEEAKRRRMKVAHDTLLDRIERFFGLVPATGGAGDRK